MVTLKIKHVHVYRQVHGAAVCCRDRHFDMCYRDRQFDSSLLCTTAASTSSSCTLSVTLHRLSPCWELSCNNPWSLSVLHAADTSPLVNGQKATWTISSNNELKVTWNATSNNEQRAIWNTSKDGQKVTWNTTSTNGQKAMWTSTSKNGTDASKQHTGLPCCFLYKDGTIRELHGSFVNVLTPESGSWYRHSSPKQVLLGRGANLGWDDYVMQLAVQQSWAMPTQSSVLIA